jgi:hypothetical protein
VMTDQMTSVSYLFANALKEGGFYIIEDVGTSYWSDWGGGLDREDTTIAFLKRLVDAINYRAHKGGRQGYRGRFARIPCRDQLPLDAFDEHLVSMSFARSLCVLRKGDNRSLDAPWE